MDIQYKIIGGDEAEYGPASLAEIKSWIRDGRVAAMTKVWRSDLAKWAAADRYTELLEDLARLHASVAATNARVYPPAGFWLRVVAYMIDFVLLTFAVTAIWMPLAAAYHWQVPEVPQTLTHASMQAYLNQLNACTMNQIMPIFYPIFMIYDVLLNGRFGATIGKMLVGARIVMRDGSPISYNRALLRWLAARLSDIFFLGYLLVALRPDKRALHDLLAGTKVVCKR